MVPQTMRPALCDGIPLRVGHVQSDQHAFVGSGGPLLWALLAAGLSMEATSGFSSSLVLSCEPEPRARRGPARPRRRHRIG